MIGTAARGQSVTTVVCCVRRSTMFAAIFLLVAGAIAKAESPITSGTTNSEHGVQSVLTQSRDALQKRMSTGKPQQQDQPPQQHPPVKKPDLSRSDQK